MQCSNVAVPRAMINEINKFWGILPEHTFSDEFTGYEDLYSEFDKHTKETYDLDPAGTIDRVFDLYRNRNLVPITYYTEAGLRVACRTFRDANYNHCKGSRIGLGNNQGQPINRFIFTNMQTAEPKGRGSNSLRDRFFHDTKLKRAIRICFEFREGNKLVYPSAMRRALELVTGENVTNFKAQNAKAIVEYLCPDIWGRVYDYSCGYGGRLLGITSSNMNYTYIGTDPNTETYNYLQYLNSIIGSNAEIHCETSQDFEPEDIDCAFSSPPYFNLEKYSDEDTQCMVQFQTLDDWFQGYAEPTVRNIHKGLNPGGLFATNIADYKATGGEFKIVDEWIKLTEKNGFKHVDTIKMMLNTRPGVGNDKQAGREKWEGVYVFSKQ
jgi:SAM-dependent methyltransferase